VLENIARPGILFQKESAFAYLQLPSLESAVQATLWLPFGDEWAWSDSPVKAGWSKPSASSTAGLSLFASAAHERLYFFACGWL